MLKKNASQACWPTGQPGRGIFSAQVSYSQITLAQVTLTTTQLRQEFQSSVTIYSLSVPSLTWPDACPITPHIIETRYLSHWTWSSPSGRDTRTCEPVVSAFVCIGVTNACCCFFYVGVLGNQTQCLVFVWHTPSPLSPCPRLFLFDSSPHMTSGFPTFQDI